MSALTLTMQDLSRALGRLDLTAQLTERAEEAARSIEDGLAARGQEATATVERDGADVVVNVTGPNLWQREHGDTNREGTGRLDAVLRERNTR